MAVFTVDKCKCKKVLCVIV